MIRITFGILVRTGLAEKVESFFAVRQPRALHDKRIRRLFRAGASKAAIARQLQIGRTLVSRTLAPKKWPTDALLRLGTPASFATKRTQMIKRFRACGERTALALPGPPEDAGMGLRRRAASINPAAIEIASRERIACCSFLALSLYR